MRNRGWWSAEDTLAPRRGDQLLTETPEHVLLREYPKRLVVCRVIADEVGPSSSTLVQDVGQVLSCRRLSVESS